MTLNGVSEEEGRLILFRFSTSILCSQTLWNLSLLSFSFSESDSSLEVFHSTSSLDLPLRGCFSSHCQLAAWSFFICKFLGWILSCVNFLHLRLYFTLGPSLIWKEKLTRIRWNTNLLGFPASSWILQFKLSYFRSYANLNFAGFFFMFCEHFHWT